MHSILRRVATFFRVFDISVHTVHTERTRKWRRIRSFRPGPWRVQVRRKGRYIGETFLKRDDARLWVTEAEGRNDQGETRRLRGRPPYGAHCSVAGPDCGCPITGNPSSKNARSEKVMDRISRLGGAPKRRRYSRLNWVALS